MPVLPLTKPNGDEAEEVPPAVPPGCSPPSAPTGGYAAVYLSAQTPQHNRLSPSKPC